MWLTNLHKRWQSPKALSVLCFLRCFSSYSSIFLPACSSLLVNSTMTWTLGCKALQTILWILMTCTFSRFTSSWLRLRRLAMVTSRQALSSSESFASWLCLQVWPRSLSFLVHCPLFSQIMTRPKPICNNSCYTCKSWACSMREFLINSSLTFERLFSMILRQKILALTYLSRGYQSTWDWKWAKKYTRRTLKSSIFLQASITTNS